MPWWVRRDREASWERYTRRVLDIVNNPALPVILADNVATYYFEATDQEYWGADDFPCLAPPYPVFWIEHKLPRMIHSTKGDTDCSQLSHHGRTGMLFVSLLASDAEWIDPPPPEVKWIYWCDHFVDYGDAMPGISGAHGAVFYAIDKEGRAVGVPWMQSFADDAHAEMMKNIMAWFNSGLLTISFMHCKNVVVTEHKVDKPLAKKWAAKHDGLQPTRYKTLIIEPLKEILRREGGHKPGGNSLQRALHIMRGKFWDYREGPGLFGKHNMLVWHPMRVRGTKGSKPPAPEVEVKI